MLSVKGTLTILAFAVSLPLFYLWLTSKTLTIGLIIASLALCLHPKLLRELRNIFQLYFVYYRRPPFLKTVEHIFLLHR